MLIITDIPRPWIPIPSFWIQIFFCYCFLGMIFFNSLYKKYSKSHSLRMILGQVFSGLMILWFFKNIFLIDGISSFNKRNRRPLLQHWRKSQNWHLVILVHVSICCRLITVFGYNSNVNVVLCGNMMYWLLPKMILSESCRNVRRVMHA